MSTYIQDSKLVGETITLKFDFLSRLAIGETLSTTVGNAVVYAGVDANPSAVLSGIATISVNSVNQKITGVGLASSYLTERNVPAKTSIRSEVNLICFNSFTQAATQMY